MKIKPNYFHATLFCFVFSVLSIEDTIFVVSVGRIRCVAGFLIVSSANSSSISSSGKMIKISKSIDNFRMDEKLWLMLRLH
jgi:hypothetical protein